MIVAPRSASWQNSSPFGGATAYFLFYIYLKQTVMQRAATFGHGSRNSAACPVWIAAWRIEEGESGGTGGLHCLRVTRLWWQLYSVLICVDLAFMVKHFTSQFCDRKLQQRWKNQERNAFCLFACLMLFGCLISPKRYSEVLVFIKYKRKK